MNHPTPILSSRQSDLVAEIKLRPELHAKLDPDRLSQEQPVYEPPSFKEFVERTTGLILDPWQDIIAERLEQLQAQTGQRILIHAPPQWGKSVIVSQRFPAWQLGVKPMHRIKLACYNITHAKKFSRACRDTMRMAEYKEMFPSEDCRIPAVGQVEEWSTMIRSRRADSQPSFGALGLLTGFVGQGADTLLIDDPYASPQDALSEAMRNSVWMFWEASAKPRLNADSNVVVMFHRYHTDDLAGRLIADGKKDGRPWEILRFPAEADGGEDDPTGREIGELLSPRMKLDFIEQQKKNQHIWMGQFQGRPLPPGGGMFKRDWFEIVDGIPLGPDNELQDATRVRRWDLAATSGGGDYTVGLRVALVDGMYYIEDMIRKQLSTPERDALTLSTAHCDVAEVGDDIEFGFPQDPGAAGKSQAFHHVQKFAGFRVYTEVESGNKIVRAGPFASQAAYGNVKLIRGDWNEAFLEEVSTFPYAKHDDVVDTASGAINRLAEHGQGHRVWLLD